MVQRYNFTERGRKVLALARDEALRRNHEYIGTEHLLLGLIGEGDGIAMTVLQNLHVDPGEIQQSIDKAVAPGKAPVTGDLPTDGRELPYTTRAKHALEIATTEARTLKHMYIGTEHLLLGLIGEGQGIAAQVLKHGGLTDQAARAEVRRLLGDASDS